eukprot:g16103.t1
MDFDDTLRKAKIEQMMGSSPGTRTARSETAAARRSSSSLASERRVGGSAGSLVRRNAPGHCFENPRDQVGTTAV